VLEGVTTVKEVVNRAGGLQKYAASEAEVTRLTITPEGPKTNVMKIDVKRALAGDPEHNLLLQRYDYILVHSVPDWQNHQKAEFIGELKFPGTYAVQRGERLSSLLERAGGYTDKAYLKGAIVKRVSVKALQQLQMKAMIDRLEAELLASGSAEVSTAATPDEAKIFAEENKQKRTFLANLRQIEPSGRMVVQFDQIDRLKNSPYDIEIEEGDVIVIPKNPQSIQVIGAVFGQSSFVYQKGKNYFNYIELCGGYTDSADKHNTYILKSNGTAIKPTGSMFWDKMSHKWNYGYAHDLDPGDTIVVPQKLDKIAWLRNIKDVTQIFFQIATTAGVLFLAF
jgi:polysaccharide biosynthesis/export protein